MEIHPFFDERTFTLTYVVCDPQTHDAVVIDPVLDYDPLASRTFTESVDRVSEFIKQRELRLGWILETHAHADHLSGSQLLRRRFDARVAINRRITKVQQMFKGIFDLPKEVPVDGSQFDRLLDDEEEIELGSFCVKVIPTPGHTPACSSYLIGDAVFTGDALFMEDYGTGRCDFPAGSSEALYESVHERLYKMPDETRVFVGHDYLPGGRALRYESTTGVEKRENKQLREETTREDFVRFRTERDATLSQPRLIYQSVQVNVDAGRLPRPHANGHRYLTLPLNLNQPTDETGAPQSG